jgi:hypothetical protein
MSARRCITIKGVRTVYTICPDVQISILDPVLLKTKFSRNSSQPNNYSLKSEPENNHFDNVTQIPITHCLAVNEINVHVGEMTQNPGKDRIL